MNEAITGLKRNTLLVVWPRGSDGPSHSTHITANGFHDEHGVFSGAAIDKSLATRSANAVQATWNMLIIEREKIDTTITTKSSITSTRRDNKIG